MKRKIRTFIKVFVICFAALYFFTEDNIFSHLFVSGGVAMFAALTEDLHTKWIIVGVKKIVKPNK